ncbi:MAG: hypothetical protein ACI9YR_002178, partial [Bacteroidia bacterium]
TEHSELLELRPVSTSIQLNQTIMRMIRISNNGFHF